MNARFLSFLLPLAVGLPLRAAWAQAPAPEQGGEVSLVRVTATTMELSFGTRGTGQGRVVAMAATTGGMPVPLVAANNTTYAANATFGQGSALGTGYVVYSGAGHSATVTGLKPGTYYYLTNAEYNADGAHIAYNTHGSSMSVATSAAAPAAALATSPAASPARQLDVYPNPSAGQPVQLLLQGFVPETLSLRLADALGRLVITQTITPLAAARFVAPLPLPAGLAAGTYVLTLAGRDRPPVQKRLTVSD